MGKVLAIDFGLKRTGLAMSDDRKIFAFGLPTVSSDQLLSFLKKKVAEENIEAFVLGLPVRMNQTDSDITENVRLLADHLRMEFANIPVHLTDERFTSKLAQQSLADSGWSKKVKKNKGLIDEASAILILQSFLAQYTSL